MVMGTANKHTEESVEDTVFKSLGNERRREIIRYLGERRTARFNEVKRDLGFEEGSSLTYHLNSLEPLLVQGEGGYSLSRAGRDAYDLMRSLSRVSASSELIRSTRRGLVYMVAANAALWAAALVSVAYVQGLQQSTMVTFIGLWFISNLVLSSLTRRLGN